MITRPPLFHAQARSAPRRFSGLVVAALLLLISNPLLAEPQTRHFEMTQRSADDVAQQVRDLYANEQVTITATGRHVMVRGEPLLLDEIGRLVETMDVPPVQMRVTVRAASNNMGKQGGGGVSVSNSHVTVEASRKVTSTRRNQERSLIVQEGHSAHLMSGQVRTLPLAIQGGRHPAMIMEQVETRSGFIVSPQVISDQAVQLNIVSFEEDPKSDMPGYETEALVTLRRVKPGQWVALGSTDQTQVGSQSGIAYETGSNSHQSTSWEVKVDLL